MASDAGRRRHGRLWIFLTVLLAFVVWHTAFDLTIDRAMKAYVAGQERHVRGDGPALSIRGSMADARRQGSNLGLAGAAVVVLLSGGAWIVWRRRR
jgi:LPXTG-motif cell wall-anchored protein